MRIFSSRQKRSWYDAFALLWIVIIGMQWVSYTEPIWFQQTTALVAVTLISVAICEMILPFRTSIRMVLKFILIGFVLYYVLSFYGVFIPNGTLPENLTAFIASLNPYVWFAICTWVMMECIIRLITDARKVLMFLGLNIVALGILDSFTPAVLWKEVAWTAFAGMAWLVCLHLRSFQIKYPLGWKRLRRNPFKIVANVIVIFSLIIVVGVNMPIIPPILTDPYTAWVKYRGDIAPTNFSSNGENGNFTNSESGYSREDNQLGGGFNYDYSPVMTIYTTERSYWRGETRDEYSGTGWQEPSFSRRSFDDADLGSELNNDGAAARGNTKQVTQSVTMLNDKVYPVLFGAYAINEVVSVDGESEANTLLWKSEQAELHWDGSRDTPFPRTYTIQSEVPLIPVDTIKAKTYEELYGTDEINSDYLQIPNRFPERVTELAKEITATSEYPYEKVSLLQNYLTTNFSYTNNPDLSLKQSNDFVDGFLFEIKEGYCDYFSTSLVMMARSLDIPARWVKGYAPGQADFAEDAAFSQNNGEMSSMSYVVTNADAHSWAEVYFGEEYGWVPVEATPGFNMPLLTSAEDADPEETPEEEEEVQPEETPEPITAEKDAAFTVSPIIGWSAVSVLILWAGYIIWRNRYILHFYVLRLRLGKPLTPDQKVVVETERWIRTVRRKGLRREQHETLRESVTRWEQEVPVVAAELSELLRQFEMARYSPDHVQENAWQEVQDLAGHMKKRLKSARV